MQACNTKQLWVTLMQQDFKAGVLEVNMPNARRDPKKKYLAKRQEFVRQEIERKKQHERQVTAVKALGPITHAFTCL